MAKAAFSKELIHNDLQSMRYDIEDMRVPRFDYAKFVKPMLDRLGYDYDFNEKSGKFTMHVAEGIQVTGQYSGVYEIAASISLKDIQDTCEIFHINFGDLESYARHFEKLIKRLLSLKEKYYQMLKDDADANLLGTAFVEPFLAEIKLKKARVYSAQRNSSKMVVEVPVFANVSLKTNNYKARCNELAMAVRSMPKCILSADVKDMMFHDICEITVVDSLRRKYRIPTDWALYECADGALFNPSEFPVVTYNDQTMSKSWPKGPADVSNNPLYMALTEMGFVYYLEGEDLIVLLNDEHYLRRDGVSHRITCRPFAKPKFEWAGVILHDKELISSLRMFCQASSDARFEGNGTQDFFEFIIRRLLPKGSRFDTGMKVNPFVYLKTTIGDNKVVKLCSYGNKIVNQLWYLFTNWTFFENWDKYMQQYPNVKLAYKVEGRF